MSTYNPRLSECGICLEPFKEGAKAYHWYEDYVCQSCVDSPENLGLVNLGSHTWHDYRNLSHG